MRSVTIGIDLGTRNAICSCVQGDSVIMIPNRWGRTATPAVVGWNDGWVVGEDAVHLTLQGKYPVWWDLKQKVGSAFNVRCGGALRTAQELLIPLFSRLREDAEIFLGDFVSSCVLTVPAFLSRQRRDALTRAAEEAGLRRTRLISDPVAAALAYGREGRFLVLDFGASSAGLSVVESREGSWQVLEMTESAFVSGREFDRALAEWLCERLCLAPLPPEDPRWRILLMEAEAIKITLSTSHGCDWKAPSDWASLFRTNREFSSFRVEREDLERMARFPIRHLAYAARCLWERHNPERLLLVGGSSRIPLVRGILEREVVSPEPLPIRAEEFPASGAALFAGRAGQIPLSADASDSESKNADMTPLERRRRLRVLKLRLTPLEFLLLPQQQDRLHSLVQQIENMDNDASSVAVLEELVRALETAVS